MRASKTIGLLRHSSTGTDAHGNETDAWTPAQTIDVYGWGPAYGSIETGNSRVVVGIDVFMPSDNGVTAQDRVLLEGVEYEVDGDVADYSNGPFAYRAGCVLRLKRVDR